MENGPFEDDFPIDNGDIPAAYVSLPEGNQLVSFQPFCSFYEAENPEFSNIDGEVQCCVQWMMRITNQW